MSVLLGLMFKASGGQERRGNYTVSDGGEFVHIDISREIVAPENSLQARLRDRCIKICRYIFMMSAVMT